MRGLVPSGRRAVVLSEVLVAVILMSLICGLGTVFMVRTIRLNSAREAYVRRLEAADFLLRRLARDVDRARGFLSRCDRYEAGDKTLILDAEGTRVVYVVDKGVVRVELTSEEASRTEMTQDPGLEASFDWEGRIPEEAKSVVTNVSWTEPPAIGISRPTLSLRSTLRN